MLRCTKASATASRSTTAAASRRKLFVDPLAHEAEGRAGITLGLDVEAAVEAADEVLPRDRRREFDQLPLVEMGR